MTPTTPSALPDTVVGRDDAHVAELGSAVLVADAHRELAAAERVGERLEHRDTVFEKLDERPRPVGVVELRLREQRRHADVEEAVAIGLVERVENLVDDERRRARLRVGASSSAPRSGRISAARLPSSAAFSARSISARRSGAVVLGKLDRAVHDLAGLGDQHEQRAARRQRQQVDALDARQRHARREHDREAVRELRERHRCLAHELVDLADVVVQRGARISSTSRGASPLSISSSTKRAVAGVGGSRPAETCGCTT